jgi:hypothetical protein
VISRDDLVFERAGKFGNDQWPKKSSEKFLQPAYLGDGSSGGV